LCFSQILVIIVLAGVQWVLKLQMVLLVVLVAAILNVVIGGFANPYFNKVCLPVSRCGMRWSHCFGDKMTFSHHSFCRP
jgi:hypothetical protein